MSRSADGDGMRTLVRKSCGSSEEEDEDGGGRDGPWSATDEDFARCPRRRSTRGSSQNSQRCAIDRRVSKREDCSKIAILRSIHFSTIKKERKRGNLKSTTLYDMQVAFLEKQC